MKNENNSFSKFPRLFLPQILISENLRLISIHKHSLNPALLPPKLFPSLDLPAGFPFREELSLRLRLRVSCSRWKIINHITLGSDSSLPALGLRIPALLPWPLVALVGYASCLLSVQNSNQGAWLPCSGRCNVGSRALVPLAPLIFQLRTRCLQ